MNSNKNPQKGSIDPQIIIERKGHRLDINEIIEKVRKSQKRDQYISQKYLQSSDVDFRWVNYNLQEKNLQLRRQLQKLSKILKKKERFREAVQTTHLQILNFRDKLRNILSHSQTLQLSLVKLKQSKKQLRKDSSSIKVQSCCCSRIRKDESYNRDTVRYAQAKRSKYKQAQKYNKKEKEIRIEAKDHYISNTVSIEKMENKETQTKIASGDMVKRQIILKQKRSHIQKLRQVILKQQSLISDYEKKLYAEGRVGKITKTSEIKANSYIRTCPSAGSIVRAELLKK